MTSYGAGLVVENRRGSDYGSIPVDALLHKLEETDPYLVDQVRDRDEFRDDDYNDYARGEIIDWAPDAPIFESDHTRRDPAFSRTRLNLRYNGTRGTVPDARHPDLFVGFTGDDPRGVDNTPRLEQYVDMTRTRAPLLELRMGDNDDNAIVESPWTEHSISEARRNVLIRAKRDMKIFTQQREGMVPGCGFVANKAAAAKIRALMARSSGESLQGPGARFIGGDHSPADNSQGGAVRGVDSGRAGSEKAPWRFTVPDIDLGVQQYGSQTGAGRSQIGAGAQAARFAPADHAWSVSAKTLSANRQTLAAGMAAAARYTAVARSARPDQAENGTYMAGIGASSGLTPATDIAGLYKHITGDQSRLPTSELGSSDTRGLMPSSDPARAQRNAEARATPNSHLTNIEAIVAGLREGSAASRREIANHVVASGTRFSPLSEGVGVVGRTVAPGSDYSRVASLAIASGSRHLVLSEHSMAAQRGVAPGSDYVHVAGLASASGSRHLVLSESTMAAQRGIAPSSDYGSVTRYAAAPMIRAAAADGLVVQTYRAAPQAIEHRVAHARGSAAAGWFASRENGPLGRSKPAEWRSATQADTTLGDTQAQTFGLDAKEVGDHGTPVGPKSLRAGAWSDSTGLTDELTSEFDGGSDDSTAL